MDTPINPPNYDQEFPVDSVNDLNGHKDSDEVVIAVMGVTGAGKSSFIKLLTGDPSVKIGENLDSQTSDIQIIHFRDPEISSRTITFVDTPGFDDSRGSGDDSEGPSFSDTDILKKIADFLLQEYDQKRKLSGLIYVQRISDPRFGGQSNRNLRMFGELCGPAAFKNVVVLTTYWDQLPTDKPEMGVQREGQLKSKFFKKLVDGGANFMRHDCTVESTRKVLRHILPMPPTITQIQTEIRKEGKSLSETSAGTVRSKEVEEAIAKYKKEIEDLKEKLVAVEENNNNARQEFEEDIAKLRKSLDARKQEQEELKMGLDEERELRKRLEMQANEFRAQFLKKIQPLSKKEQAKKSREYEETTREAVDRALREARKQPFRRRMIEIAKDAPLVPNFIGKPILGIIGLFFDALKAIVDH